MAFRRRLGNVAEMLLRSHLQDRNNERESERTNQSQVQLRRLAAAPEIVKYMSEHPENADQMAELGPSLGIDLNFARPTNTDLLAPTRNKLAGVTDEGSLPSNSDLVNQVAPLGRGMTNMGYGPTPQQTDSGPQDEASIDPSTSPLPSTQYGPTPGPTIQALMTQRDQQQNKIRENVMRQLGIKQGEAQATAMGTGLGAGMARHQNAPTDLADEISQIEGTAGPHAAAVGLQAGAAEDARMTPDRIAARVGEHGATTSADAAASYPYQVKLAQVHADTALLNQKRIDDYRKAHPAATAEQLNQVKNAGAGLGIIGDVRVMLDEMDKRGMIGPIAGRGAELAAGRIKSEDLFKSPDDAKLAAQYFSTVDLLQKLAAKVHGGVRAGASPQMSEQFKRIVSGIGDRSIIEGQLNAVEDILQRYQNDPEHPPVLDIPGGQSPLGPQQDPAASALDKAKLLMGIPR